MQTGIYCIAHTIREYDPAIATVVRIRDVLDHHGIKTSRPKMGYHITAIPPFRTTEDAAKMVAWACDYWDSVMLAAVPASDLTFSASGIRFDFFRGQPNDTFIIRLEMDPTISRAIERGRKRIPDVAEWVYPPENYDFNPHLSIGEGENVFGPIGKLVRQNIIPAKDANVIVRLEPPKVLRKNEARRCWEPVA